MINVPLMLRGPGLVPRGKVVDETVQSIDLMPTLLELSRLPVPERAQGQSLLPLLVDGERPHELGFRRWPAFAERAMFPSEPDPKGRDVESTVVIEGGWKLIRNTTRPEGWPEYELYNHREDPLDVKNVAAAHPEVLEKLKELLESWHKAALAARVPSEETTEGLSTEERERLRPRLRPVAGGGRVVTFFGDPALTLR